MSERESIEQLHNALVGAAAPPADRGTRELLAIARGLLNMPREDFRTKLKADLKEKAMATAVVNFIPKGFHSVTPYLLVQGAAQFIEFLKQAFGAEENLRVPRPDGTIMHAEIKIGDSIVELGDGNEQYPARPANIHLYLEDTDAAYERALQAGATSIHQPEDMPYGERSGGVKDPAGNNWYIATQFGPQHIPEGLRTINPYFHPQGTDKLIDFLKNGFGAEEVGVYREPAEGPIVHAKIRVGDTIVEMGESHGQYQPMPFALHYYVPDVDAVYRRALEAGAKSISPPTDQPYGERSAGVIDPAGNQWFIATLLRMRE
jgi:PhnB protein